MSAHLYKCLAANLSSAHGGNGKWVPGQWRSVRGELVACERGIHLARASDVLTWLAPRIWVAEYDGERMDCDDKIVVRRARIVEETRWREQRARLFAADCAARVLHLFEKSHPNDLRPRQAIEAARAFARGEIGDAAWAAASDAARAAVSDAASDAAWAAASDAAKEWQTNRLLLYVHDEQLPAEVPLPEPVS